MPTMLVACQSIGEAQDLLRYCLGGGGTVKPGKHFREELKAEGLDLPNAWQVLRAGIIFNPPEVDVKTREWKDANRMVSGLGSCLVLRPWTACT